MALESSADEAHLQGQASAEELDPSTADGREQAVIGCHVRHSALTPEAQKRIKAICFDLDDTLCVNWWDNSEVLAAACAAHTRWLAERHPDVEQPLRAAPLGHRMMSIAKRQTHLSHCYTLLREAAVREVLAEAQLPPSEHESVIEASMAHYLKARSDVVLFDGALEALQTLKARGYVLAALSNGNADVCQVPALREAGDVFAVHLHPGK
ncbi:yigB, partial [Symbiodinium sp. KB8]